jgi:hypothetical protein
MSERPRCVGCQQVAPDEGSEYTWIGSGWRLTRNRTAEGVVMEWRCLKCFKAFKAAGG